MMLLGYTMAQWAALLAWYKNSFGAHPVTLDLAFAALVEWQTRYSHDPGSGSLVDVSYEYDWEAAKNVFLAAANACKGYC